jgi:fermentation-respiration switch protein FrsA (DUF1100 family)
MLQILIVAAGIYLGLGLLMWAAQTQLIFPAPKLSTDLLNQFASDRSIRVLEIPTEDGLDLYAWHDRSPQDRVVILFLGNAETLAGAWPLHQQLRQLGWDVVSFAYRGYPGSPGSPSEAGIQRDSRAVWRYTVEVLGYSPERIVLHGRSLGGGAVGTIMDEVEPAAIVLQSTFRSITAMARQSYPVYPIDLLLHHRFDTEAKAPRVQTPVLILHSAKDEVIPVSHGRALAKGFPRADYLEVEDLGHNEDLVLGDVNALRQYRRFLEEHVPTQAKPPE